MAAKDQPGKTTKMVWRSCLKCSTRLSELCYDTHTLCETCRNKVCDLNSFCEECESWTPEFRKLYLRNKRMLFQEYEEPVYSYSTYPGRRQSSSKSQHSKMSPPFASSEGASASGDRLQSDSVQDTHLLPHS